MIERFPFVFVVVRGLGTWDLGSGIVSDIPESIVLLSTVDEGISVA
jgi:hypothetical protein